MLNVLIVEDELTIRQGIVYAVDWDSIGCRVAGEASNGAEALEAVGRLEPDLIVTDLKMPVMGGLEMVRRLREAGNWIPVIILTAYDSFDYARQAIRLGAVDYLLKPFHDGDLEAAVVRVKDRLAAGEDGEADSPLDEVRQRVKSKYVLDAMDYIGAHYADSGLSVSEIAENCGVSEGHLSHVFKKESGYSPISYLTLCRIHAASRLLLERNLKIYEVCSAVGYRDIAYFSNTFKKLTGMTPSEYQNNDGRRSAGEG